MPTEIKIDQHQYHWPTAGEWQRLKPVQRKERALKLLIQAVNQEQRDKGLSEAVKQALFLAEDALGRHPDE